MSPVYLNPQPSSPIPFIELKGDNNDQKQNTLQVFGYLHGDHLATSNNNSSSCSYNSNNDLHSKEMLSLDYSRHDQVKVENLALSHEKASDPRQQPYSSWLQNTNGDSNCGSSHTTYSINNHSNNDHNKLSRKWKSPKVIKMTNSNNSREGSKQKIDHDISKRQSNDLIRVCSDCHTTTTPLWRSGPQGPKSLCNACGIRQRKARRAAMAAATRCDNDAMVTSMSHIEALKPKVQVIKSKNGSHHRNNHTLPLKKRRKLINDVRNYYNSNNNYTHSSHNNSNNIYFEDFTLSSNKDYVNANSKRFPSDEEEGAILLMALSYGLACS